MSGTTNASSSTTVSSTTNATTITSSVEPTKLTKLDQLRQLLKSTKREKTRLTLQASIDALEEQDRKDALKKKVKVLVDIRSRLKTTGAVKKANNLMRGLISELVSLFPTKELEYDNQVYRFGESEIDGIIADPIEIFHNTANLTPTALEDQEGWEEKSKKLLGPSELYTTFIEPLVPTDVPTEYRAPYDSFRGFEDFDVLTANEGQRVNQVVTIAPIVKGKITGDFTDPRTRTNNMKKAPSPVFRMGVGQAKHYQGGGDEELATFSARYGGEKRQFSEGEGSKALQKKIAANMFEKIIDETKLKEAMNDIACNNVYNGWLEKARSAGYAASHSLFAEECEKELRFFPKQNAKVVESPLDVKAAMKAPQGISAWDKAANTYFASFCRFVSDVIRHSLKDNVVWNNGISVETAARKYTAACAKVPGTTNVTFDAVAMDSLQNSFTHGIMYEFDCLLGFNEDFLKLYYNLIKSYVLKGTEFVAYLEWIMPSGMPWTLKNNSFLQTAIVLYVMDYKHEAAIFTQGDDLNLFAAEPVMIKTRMDEIQQYCDYSMVVSESTVAAFCGFVQASGVLAPNIRRKLFKLMAASIRSADHFYQIQTSLRDWCEKIKKAPEFVDIIALNSQTYRVEQEQVETWFDCIESLSHCSYDQYLSVAREVPINIHYMSDSGDLMSVY